MDKFMLILAQVLGFITTAQCLVHPFFKKRWQMLVNTIVMNVLIGFSAFIIGGYVFGSAIFIYVVAVTQSVIAVYHAVKEQKVSLFESVLFSLLYIICGVIGMVISIRSLPDGENLAFTVIHEILPVIGALMLCFSVFAKDEQTMRKFGLVNAAVWSVYFIYPFSTTIFTELTALTTVCIALYKYRAKKDESQRVSED